MTLDELRVKIDTIDDTLLKLYNERMELVHQVGELKNTMGAPIYRPEREQAILDRLKSQNKGTKIKARPFLTLAHRTRAPGFQKIMRDRVLNTIQKGLTG